jgi:hypothetical protein
MPEDSCGIDGVDRHHEFALVDQPGQQLASSRIEYTASGLIELQQVLGAAVNNDGDRIPGPSRLHAHFCRSAAIERGRDHYAINLWPSPQ